jgi:hypothetical protein
MLAPARASLSEAATAIEWEVGRSLTLEEAIDLALSVK